MTNETSERPELSRDLIANLRQLVYMFIFDIAQNEDPLGILLEVSND